MLDPTWLNDLAHKLCAAVPADLRGIQKDLDHHFHAILQAAFAKLNLVSREEFDIQTKVLAKTRAKLEALEQKVAELE